MRKGYRARKKRPNRGLYGSDIRDGVDEVLQAAINKLNDSEKLTQEEKDSTISIVNTLGDGIKSNLLIKLAALNDTSTLYKNDRGLQG